MQCGYTKIQHDLSYIRLLLTMLPNNNGVACFIRRCLHTLCPTCKHQPPDA